MEVEYCGTCPHPAPRQIHRGGRGRCRMNGCPCQSFTAPPALEPAGDVVEIANSRPVVSTEAFTAILTAVAFVAGVLLGMNL